MCVDRWDDLHFVGEGPQLLLELVKDETKLNNR
jgi:hypothetical protein